MKDSKRICQRKRSVMVTFLKAERSKLLIPGARTEFRAEFPYRPNAGWLKTEVSKAFWGLKWKPLGLGLPLISARFTNASRTPPRSVAFTENGKPAWKFTIPLICQPPRIRSAGLLTLPRK